MWVFYTLFICNVFNQNQIHDRPHETVPCYIYEFKDPSKASVRPTVKGRVLQSKERAIYKKVIDNLSIELGLNFYIPGPKSWWKNSFHHIFINSKSLSSIFPFIYFYVWRRCVALVTWNSWVWNIFNEPIRFLSWKLPVSVLFVGYGPI